jgi:hypothetical protein
MNRNPLDLNQPNPQDNDPQESEMTPIIQSTGIAEDSEVRASLFPQAQSTPTMKVQS